MCSSRAVFRCLNKLKKSKDFQKVFAAGVRAVDKYFLFLATNNGTQVARLGIVIPKRRVQKSVQRNRIKRIIRESFRLRQQRFIGSDIIVLLRSSPENLDQTTFDRLLDKNWKKIDKCNPSS